MEVIHLRFSLLKIRLELLIAAATGGVAANIGLATIYGALNIDEHVKNKKQRIVKEKWQNCTSFIIDEISMVFLKLLFTIDFKLSQAKRQKDNNIAVLSGLSLIIMMRDF